MMLEVAEITVLAEEEGEEGEEVATAVVRAGIRVEVTTGRIEVVTGISILVGILEGEGNVGSPGSSCPPVPSPGWSCPPGIGL